MIRVGLGYDIHRFTPGRRLVLGGVEIPSSEGLAGHSDADVIVHALMDSLLGAAALGDIGRHFPPDDPQYAGMSSLTMLSKVDEMLRLAHYRVGNLDMMVVAERPKLAPYIEEMRHVVATALNLPVHLVSIKATTNEGLGAEGRQEGISAQAVALLEHGA